MKKMIALILLLAVAMPALADEDVPDGSFENFDDTWQCDSNCTLPVTDYFIFSSYAVDGIAYAYIFHDAGIYQDLTIPSDAATLHFWYDNQPDDLAEEDGVFIVYLLNSETSEIYTQQTYETQSDIWIEGTLDIPSELRGQAVRLYITNTTGYNRIDYLQFYSVASEDDTEPAYATVKFRVKSRQGKAVQDAKVYIKKSGERLDILNLKNDKTVTQVETNAKGRTPQFTILRELDDGETVKVCAKKNKITECVQFSPITNETTTYDLSFTSKKVR